MSTFYWLRVAFRNIAAAALIVVVWLHSHWSVAAAITVLWLAEELRSVIAELESEKRKILRVAVDSGVMSMNQAVLATLGIYEQ